MEQQPDFDSSKQNEQSNLVASPFDAIQHIDEQGHEYWSARELYKLLGYSTWQKFQYAIKQAKKSCEQSGQVVSDHFNLQVKLVAIGSKAQRKMDDCHLSRYACYLCIQNADPTGKPIVALAQTYFAVQTRRQELAGQIAALQEDQQRLIYRSEMAILNQKLNEAAHQAGVISPSDFAIFADHGYRGLYGGLTENAIHTRKQLAEGERLVAFVDWQEMGVSAALMDFVQTVLGFCFVEPVEGSDCWAVFDPDLYRALYTSYTSIRPFTPYELEHLDKALKYVALTQPVWAMLTWEQYHPGKEMIETRLLYWMYGIDKLNLSAL